MKRQVIIAKAAGYLALWTAYAAATVWTASVFWIPTQWLSNGLLPNIPIWY
jgi:hypothetical protein